MEMSEQDKREMTGIIESVVTGIAESNDVEGIRAALEHIYSIGWCNGGSAAISLDRVHPQ